VDQPGKGVAVHVRSSLRSPPSLPYTLEHLPDRSGGADVAKLRHLAVATEDPDTTAQFYMDVFEFTWVRKAGGDWGYGHILTDGTMNLAVLRFTEPAAAGLEKGPGFAGLHHIGIEVDDIDGTAAR